jgi:hypothetical protein
MLERADRSTTVAFPLQSTLLILPLVVATRPVAPTLLFWVIVVDCLSCDVTFGAPFRPVASGFLFAMVRLDSRGQRHRVEISS